MLWVIDKLRTLCGVIGAACLIGLIGAAVMAAAGATSFPAPLSQTETEFGRYALETGGMFVGALLAWRLLGALGLRLLFARVAARSRRAGRR
jgi:hypothetical protein